MRRPRYLDLKCTNCGHAVERFVETNDDNTPLEPQLCDNPELFPADEDQPAGYCRAPMERIECGGIGYMKTITRGNHDYNERERKRLEARGEDHWKREGRHEAIERERAVLKRNGMEGAGGVK